jgi:hypothetical protein
MLRSGSAGSERRMRASVLTLIVVGWTLIICSGCGSNDPSGVPRDGGRGPANTEVSYAFDPGDKRQLVSSAENVFVGRVVKRAGQASLPTSAAAVRVPQTQVAVRVVTNIKGYLRGTVTVNQYGGRVDTVVERGGRRRVEPGVDLWEGDPLLKSGEVVLLATAYNSARDWHTIVAQPFADQRIRSRATGKRLVREFREARRARRSK